MIFNSNRTMVLKTLELKVADYMTPVPITVGPEFAFQDAISLMAEKGIGSVVVEKNKKPFGIFTERDLLVNVLNNEVKLNGKVGGYCSSPLIITEIGITGGDAAKMMAAKKIKRLVLTKDGKISAIVTARDIVDAFQLSFIDYQN